jgi:hypothetical protein
MVVPRNYHSTALLLPDGRVYVGGGGACGDCAPADGYDPNANHPDYNYYTPPYLLNADGTPAARPTISAAPTTYTLGTPLTVAASADITSFSLVRFGSSTHAIDSDQRRESVGIASNVNGNYTLGVNPDPGITVPGYWMLFGMNANGTPSVASIVQISSAPAAVPAPVAPAAAYPALPELANATLTAQDWLAGSNNVLAAQAAAAGSLYDPSSLVPAAGSLTDPTQQGILLPNNLGGGST